MKETDKIIIKETKIEDLKRILIFEKENNRFVNEYSLEEHKEVLEKEYHLSIFEKVSNKLIGYIILAGISNPNKIIEFRRIVVSKKGFGYGKEALKLIKDIGFKVLGAAKIWLDVYEDNIRAIRLYESQGFCVERIKNLSDNRNLLVMSISK